MRRKWYPLQYIHIFRLLRRAGSPGQSSVPTGYAAPAKQPQRRAQNDQHEGDGRHLLNHQLVSIAVKSSCRLMNQIQQILGDLIGRRDHARAGLVRALVNDQVGEFGRHVDIGALD